jgi:PilZ domain
MSLVSMPQLVEGQSARLDVGESLPCRIIGFSGSDVVLALDAQPEDDPPELGAPAYLLLEADGRMQAVRGRIGSPLGEEVILRVTDDIRLGQRRTFSRAPLPLPVRLRSRSGSEWTTMTRDVSAGGVCVAREGADAVDGKLELRIQVADHEVVAEAVAVRVTDAELGLRFEQIERDDRLLLASLALAYHRRR